MKEMERLIKRAIVQDTASVIAQGVRNFVWVKDRPIMSVENIGEINGIEIYVVKNVTHKEVIDSFTTHQRLNEFLGNMQRRYGFKIEDETEENGGVPKFKLYTSN